MSSMEIAYFDCSEGTSCFITASRLPTMRRSSTWTIRKQSLFLLLSMLGYASSSVISSEHSLTNFAKSLYQSKLPSLCPGKTRPKLYCTEFPVASVHVTRVSTSCFTVRKASLTSIDAIMPSWCSLMAKKQIGRILLAKLEVAGEKSDSLSGCSQAYSLATSLLRRSQIASPESFFFSLQVRTNLVLTVLQSRGKLSSFKTSSPTRGWTSTWSASASSFCSSSCGSCLWEAELFETCTNVYLDFIWVLIQVQFMLNQSINIVRVKRDIRFDV